METELPGLGGNMLTLNELRKVLFELEWGDQRALTVKTGSKMISIEWRIILEVGDEEDVVEEQTPSIGLGNQALPYQLKQKYQEISVLVSSLIRG